jgi:deoxyadenosine/deoxycytidine kinase
MPRTEAQPPPRYMVVDGPIGVGKTSLARRLAESLQAELILEQAAQNPFLERFYRDPANAALSAQLFFLLERARIAQSLRQSDLFQPVRVADFMLAKDRLFAELTLDGHELRLYEQIYAGLALDAPAPDLVIYLQAPVDVLLDRIVRRGIAYEQSIGRSYLARVVDAYARYFHYYDEGPLLIVNAATVDLAGDEPCYEELLRRVLASRRGRQYYNPGELRKL